MRIKTLRISAEVLADFLKEPNHFNSGNLTQKGMPADASIVDARFEDGRTLFLTVKSAEFEDVPYGSRIPEFMVTFSKEPAA